MLKWHTYEISKYASLLKALKRYEVNDKYLKLDFYNLQVQEQ